MRFAGLSAAAAPFAVALVVVEGFAPRGAIVLSLAVPAPAEGVVEAPAAVGSAAGAVDVDGIAGVAAVVDVSAALATPIPDRPIAEAISA
jgi:hypothetical protein